MARRLAPVLLAALLLPALVVPAAHGDVRSKRDRGAAKARGLNAAERKALDVSRVTAIGTKDGLLVAVRLKGSFERRAGRGRLRRSAVALILRPKSRRAKPAILATTGRSRRPDTLRSTRSSRVGVARIGKTVYFAISGSGLGGVRRVQVKTFARLGRRRPGRQAKEIRISPAQARFLLGEDGTDASALAAPATANDCNELREVVRGARQAESAHTARIRQLFNDRSAQEQRNSLITSRSAVHEVLKDALVEFAERCGTGLKVLCSGYRHLSMSKSRVSADFALDPVFVLEDLSASDFIVERFNTATGKFERLFGADGSIVAIGEGRWRYIRDIDTLGRYRITGALVLGDRAFEGDIDYMEEFVVEINVPGQPPPAGGDCPPDP